MRDLRLGGFVLPVVLLFLLALTAAAHGVLAQARHQRLAGWAATAAVQARLASESAVRIGVTALGQDPILEALRRGETVEPAPRSLAPRVVARTRLERLRPEWLWAVGTGVAARGRLTARRRTGALYWGLEKDARVAALSAGLEHGGVLGVAGDGRVRGSDAVGAPEDWPEEVCSVHAPALEALLAPEGVPASAPLDEPPLDGASEGGEPDPLADVPRLGLLDGPRLDRAAGIRYPGGWITPGPITGLDGCDTSSETNWGAPDDPTGPCGAHVPLVVVPGSVVLEGGRGQGILVVAGDLTLTDDARFVGMALVGGALRIHSGARLQGAVRVRGGARVAGRLEASPCAVRRILDGREELSRPLSVPGGGWIPLP